MATTRTLRLTIDMEVSVLGESEILAADHIAIDAKHPQLVNPTDALSSMIYDVVFEAIAKLKEDNGE